MLSSGEREDERQSAAGPAIGRDAHGTGGTGGALFRNLFRDFLAECDEHIESGHLRTGHSLYTGAATLWTQVAAPVAAAGESGDSNDLMRAGSVLHELSRIERDAMRALSMLRDRSKQEEKQEDRSRSPDAARRQSV